MNVSTRERVSVKERDRESERMNRFELVLNFPAMHKINTHFRPVPMETHTPEGEMALVMVYFPRSLCGAVGVGVPTPNVNDRITGSL